MSDTFNETWSFSRSDSIGSCSWYLVSWVLFDFWLLSSCLLELQPRRISRGWLLHRFFYTFVFPSLRHVGMANLISLLCLIIGFRIFQPTQIVSMFLDYKPRQGLTSKWKYSRDVSLLFPPPRLKPGHFSYFLPGIQVFIFLSLLWGLTFYSFSFIRRSTN